MSIDWSAWQAKRNRRKAHKTTVSVKLTDAELAALDALRSYPYEPRGDTVRRLVSAETARLTVPVDAKCKTNGAGGIRKTASGRSGGGSR